MTNPYKLVFSLYLDDVRAVVPIFKEKEIFFKNIIDSLNEGGCYFFIDAAQIFYKSGNVLIENKKALQKVKGIVSNDFYNNYFKLKEIGE